MSLKVVRLAAAAAMFAITCTAPSAFAAVAQRSLSSQASSRIAEARALVQAGRTADAINAYKLLIAELPTVAVPRIELAQLLARSPATRLEAEEVFKEATVLAPGDLGLALERAANLLAAGDAVNAALEYRRASEISPQSRAAINGYVGQVVRLGAGPVAIKQHANTLAKAPSDLTARLILAELLRSEARYHDAFEQFNSVLRSNSGNVMARLGAAESLLALGFFEQAEKISTAGIETAATKGDPQLTTLRARIYLAAGRPEAALLLLRAESAKWSEKDASFVLSETADIYRALGQTGREREMLEKLQPVSAAGYDPGALARLARVRFETGDREAARAACEQLLAADPRHAIGALGLKLLALPPPAAPLIDFKIITPARRAGFHGEAGEAALFWNKPDLAVISLRSAISARPNSPRLLLGLGTALLRANAAPEAVKAFANVAVSEGRRPDALLGWAAAELAANKVAQAIAVYEDVIRLDPSNFPAHLGLTEAYVRVGEYERAALLLSDLARRAPESQLISKRLSASLAARGRPYRTVPAERAKLFVASSATIGAALSNNDASFELLRIEPLLLAGDTISVTVSGRARHTAVVTLDDEGKLRLPFLKQALSAKCLSERELEAALLKQESGSLKSSTIEISLTKMRRDPLVVGGAVYLPNGYYVRTTLNLREALMLASGADNRAGRSVYVVRGAGLAFDASCGASPTNPPVNDAAKQQLEVYERDMVERGNIESLQKVGAGDLVFVPERDSALITGAVAQIGFVSVRERPRLSEVIKGAGGTLAGVDRSRIVLRRLLPQGISYQQFIINLTDIEQQQIGDVILQAGDVIEIPAPEADRFSQHSVAAVLRRLAYSQQSPATNNAPQKTVTAGPAATIKEKP